MSARIPVLYLAPWVGYGGSDKNTIDWFRWIDRERFAPSLIATQPSPNPLLDQVEPYADEVWVLPELMPAAEMPAFIFDFLGSRQIEAIHLMNSRIGFDLLPDLAALAKPPAVVVQMHAEEVDRSGYVRYVSTRYGDLVDCFSLSNEHVANALREYGVPESKLRVIYTGIDADGEFSPDLAEPIEELPSDRLQILFAARLVDQKDPLLMVEVAAALRDRGAAFQIHVVGEGDLEEQIEARVAELDLGEHVVLHPPTAGLLSWYAATDVLLLTSTFEGVPVVLFEAMAMGLPIVTPGLPAIRELLDEADEGVVAPRDSVQGYVEPLAHLAEDRRWLAQRSEEMRTRARELFSVQQMASDHERLYEELIAGRAEELSAGPTGAAGEVASAPDLAALCTGDPSAVDPVLWEKVRRRFAVAGPGLDAIALADAGPEGRFHFRTLPLDDGPADPVPHAVIWRRDFERELPKLLQPDWGTAVAAVVDRLAASGALLEWRHLPTPDSGGAPTAPRQLGAEPLPGAGAYAVPRWDEDSTWVPPSSQLLRRGEHVLGAVRDRGFQGTAKLIEAEGSYRAVPRDEWEQLDASAVELGYVELAPLPGMDPLSLARHRDSGEHVLVCPAGDPLLPQVDLLEHLGFLDPVPLKPREVPSSQRPLGLLGLVKTLDLAGRRHRYGVGSIPSGEVVMEVGALARQPLRDSIAAAIVDDYLVTERHQPPRARPALGEAARWVAGPLVWRDLAPQLDRAKVAARRATIAGRRALRPGAGPDWPLGTPAGWLSPDPRPGLVPLHAAYHPVTGDQLLTREEESAAALGYGEPTLLGYLHPQAPLTGERTERAQPIPWARRFGHVPRPG